MAREAYAYDSEGRLTGAVVTDTDGVFEEGWFYAYDARGHRVTRLSYFGDINYAVRTDHEFDQHGREMAKHLRYITDPEKNQDLRNTYDELNRLIEANFYDLRGKHLSQWKYHYNARGELYLLSSEYYASGRQSELKESSQKDDHGNWIKWEQTSCSKSQRNMEIICQEPYVRSRIIRYYSETGQ